MRRKKRYKRKPHKPIDYEKFHETRLMARLTQQEAACLLHVTERTIRLWESGTTAIPYAAYKLLRIWAGFDLPGKAWEGWRLHSGSLWSPAGRRFEAHELAYLSLTFSMARHWQADYERRSLERVQKEPETLPLLRLVKS